MPWLDRLGTDIEVLSCCEPYTRYGRRLSVVTWYISAVGWLYCGAQESPPLKLIVPPPSFPRIIRFGFAGSIHKSWLSPCGAGTGSNTLPPSMLRNISTFNIQTV